MSMANMACITKQGSQTPIIRAVVGDKNTKNFTFVVERFDGDEDLSGLVWMIEVENAQGVTDGTALFTYRTDKQIQLIWPVGGIATAVEGRTQLQVSGFDTGMNKQWGSGLYYIEVVRGMTPDDEQLKPVSQLQELIQQTVREGVVAVQNTNGAIANANAAAEETRDAIAGAEAATDNAEAAAGAANQAAEGANSAAQAAQEAAGNANAAAGAANGAAANADNKGQSAQEAAQEARNAAQAARDAAQGAQNAAQGAQETAGNAASQAANAAGVANAAAAAAAASGAAADTSAANATAAAQAATSAANNAGDKATEAKNAANAAETAANAATNAASNANAATSAASAAAARAETVANMTVEAETLNPGSQATAQYKDGKLTLGIPRGEDGSGGAGMPAGEAPYQMLATGPDGKTQWVDRTHYDYPAETIIPLHDMEMKNGYKSFTEPFERIPTPGRTYHITYYGYDYDVVAEEWMDGDVRCISLGNKQLIGGYISQEPFIFVFYADNKQILGAYGYFSCSANKDSIAVSIEATGELKKIDPKFLPEGAGGGSLPTGGEPYKQLVTDGEGNAVWEDRLAYEEANALVEILPETELVGQGGEFGYMQPLAVSVAEGEACVVTYNGDEYTCTVNAVPSGTDLPGGALYLGNREAFTEEETDNTGEPFVAIIFPDALFEQYGFSVLCIPIDESTTVTLGIRKEGYAVHTIPPKYLPDGIGYETEGGVVLPETEMVEDNGVFMTHQPLHRAFVAGAEYTVMWNGVAYKSKAVYLVVGGDAATVLGNVGAMGFGEQTEEPFVIIDSSASTGGSISVMAEALDGSESVTLAISGGSQVHKIDPKYLPEGIGYETPNTLSLVMEACNIIHDPGGDYCTENTLTEDLVLGAEYTIRLDGVEYKTICRATGVEYPPFVLGNPRLITGEDTGEPFAFASDGKAGGCLWYWIDNNDFLQSTIEVFKGSSGGIHTIPMKYLPEHLYGQEGDMSEVLPETTAFYFEATGTETYHIITPFTSPLLVSREYVVTYQGKEYRCRASMSYNDTPCVGDYSLEEYPFYIIDYQGEYYIDGQVENGVEYGVARLKDPSAPFSIRNGGVLKKIDPMFLPPVSDVVLTSPNGTKYRLNVADDGSLGTVVAE